MKYDKYYRVYSVHDGGAPGLQFNMIADKSSKHNFTYDEAVSLAEKTARDTGKTVIVTGVFDEFGPEKPKIERTKFVE